MLQTRDRATGDLTGLTGNFVEVTFPGPESSCIRRLARVRVTAAGVGRRARDAGGRGMSSEGAIGVIGGSGLYELEGLSAVRWKAVRTPFGDPSDEYCVRGSYDGRRVIFLPRHGRGHRSDAERAELPREHLGAQVARRARGSSRSRAVGSMKEDDPPARPRHPRAVLRPTRRRVSSFFGEGIVGARGHGRSGVPDAGRRAREGRRARGSATVHAGRHLHLHRGPAVLDRAESRIYRSWGVDVIGMTNMPEAKLAREAELCYATMALVTDYDCWHESHEAVTVEAVIRQSRCATWRRPRRSCVG